MRTRSKSLVHNQVIQSDRSLLISIKPRFATAILDGSKGIELRRKPPTIDRGTKVLIYSSSPTKAIVGFGVIGDVFSGSLREVWRLYGKQAGVTSKEYESYFSGCSIAHALDLSETHWAPEALPLSQLREEFGIQPPQSWRYLETRTADKITNRIAPASTMAS